MQRRMSQVVGSDKEQLPVEKTIYDFNNKGSDKKFYINFVSKWDMFGKLLKRSETIYNW